MSASATQGGHKKLKPDLITSYDLQPGNRASPILQLLWPTQGALPVTKATTAKGKALNRI